MPPRRAWWVGPTNVLLLPAERARSRSAAAAFAGLQRAAVRRAGTCLPPDPEFHAGMRVLHDAFHAAVEVTPIGRLGMRAELTRRMANHHGLRDLFDRHPEVGRVPVTGPVFVTGLPRTGTTLLHGLLAQHPQVRAPLLWELMYPLPGSPAARRRRIRAARWTARIYHAAVPALRTIHPLDPTGAEECVFVLPHTLAHYARARMPDYRRWCADRDTTEDYRYLRQHLQVLQWRRPQRRWVLKSPFHLGNLDALLRVFPDATIVWTDRDPVVALTSWCSLVEATMRLQNARVDLPRIGADWLDIWAEALGRGMRTRSAAGDRFVDVGYEDLIVDPAGTAARLWQRLGSDVGGASRAAMAAVAGRDRRHPGGHRYAAERYGLDPSVVRERLSGNR